VDTAHVVLALGILRELHPVAFEAAHHVVAAGRGLVDGALIDDAVVGASDLGEAEEIVQTVGVLVAGDHGAGALDAGDETFGPEDRERFAHGMTGNLLVRLGKGNMPGETPPLYPKNSC
jgi:hypothetical protein